MEAVKAQRAGKPAALIKKPEPVEEEEKVELLDEALPYWGAFQALNMQRQTHDMPQPFTISDIRAYADVAGFVKEELPVYFEIIQEMDALYLQVTYAKIEEQRKQAAEKAKRNQGNV